MGHPILEVFTMQQIMTKSSIEQLEKMLDSLDYLERRNALNALMEKVHAGEITLPLAGTDVNLHFHTFFSYNSSGYSPTKIAWLARKKSLAVTGVIDFDVLDALEEFLDAAKILNLKACAGLETRVFVPELADKVINSPGEPGIAYHIGIGFPAADVSEKQKEFLANLHRTAQQRNKNLINRLNEYLNPAEISYENDVLVLTPSNNPTERHICLAYARKAQEIFTNEAALKNFWYDKLGIKFESEELHEGKNLLNTIRAKTIKKGGIGYVSPDRKSFPLLAETNQFFLETGAIPTLAWLDGTSEAEKDIENLLEIAIESGVAAINIIPDRNYTPDIKDEKLENLYRIVELAQELHLPAIVGTEMNSPGQKFVDSFDTKELSPLMPVFLKGAYIIYAHSVLQQYCGLGYTSIWAEQNFNNIEKKNTFFEKLGRLLEPEYENRCRDFNNDTLPQQILNEFE